MPTQWPFFLLSIITVLVRQATAHAHHQESNSANIWKGSSSNIKSSAPERRNLLQTCNWKGHCLGDPCVTYDDCDNIWVCVGGKCAVSGAISSPPPPGRSPPPPLLSATPPPSPSPTLLAKPPPPSAPILAKPPSPKPPPRLPRPPRPPRPPPRPPKPPSPKPPPKPPSPKPPPNPRYPKPPSPKPPSPKPPSPKPPSPKPPSLKPPPPRLSPPPAIAARRTTITSYNIMSSDNTAPGALAEYTVTQAFVNSINVVAVHSADWPKFKYHKLQITYLGISAEFQVWDYCADSDCGGCCTANKNYNSNGFLTDVDSSAALRVWGIQNAENSLFDTATIVDVGSVNPDTIIAQFPGSSA